MKYELLEFLCDPADKSVLTLVDAVHGPSGSMKTGIQLRRIVLSIKPVLALWFRLIIPLICYFQDRLDPQPLTSGYFIDVRKA